MPVRRTNEGNAQLLRDQYTLLRDSVDGFYSGTDAKAIEIAVRIRTLVHQSDASRPLLSIIEANYLQLPIFHKVLMPGVVFLFAVNQGVQIGGGPPKFFRPDFSSSSYSLVSLERWWNEAYLVLGPIRTSKKQIILDVANKDGGAHVDPDIPVRHAAASEPPVLFGSSGAEGEFKRMNLARGTVAQAGYELLDYLENHFRPILSPVLPPSTLDSAKTAAINAGFSPMPPPDATRVPFTRASNFLNVHTDGKWPFTRNSMNERSRTTGARISTRWSPF